MSTRITGCIACILVAIDCAQKALGAEPQFLFASDDLWIWWFAAFFWGVSAIQQIMEE